MSNNLFQRDREDPRQGLDPRQAELTKTTDWVRSQAEAFASCPSCFLGTHITAAAPNLTQDEIESSRLAAQTLARRLEEDEQQPRSLFEWLPRDPLSLLISMLDEMLASVDSRQALSR